MASEFDEVRFLFLRLRFEDEDDVDVIVVVVAAAAKPSITAKRALDIFETPATMTCFPV